MRLLSFNSCAEQHCMRSIPGVYTTANDKQVLNMVSWNFLGLAGDSNIEVWQQLCKVQHDDLRGTTTTCQSQLTPSPQIGCMTLLVPLKRLAHMNNSTMCCSEKPGTP